MRVFLTVLPFLLLAQAAMADPVLDCSSIKKASARLACYDKSAVPPKTEVKPGNSDFTDIANPFSAEEALTTARLKGICRGC